MFPKFFSAFSKILHDEKTLKISISLRECIYDKHMRVYVENACRKIPNSESSLAKRT